MCLEGKVDRRLVVAHRSLLRADGDVTDSTPRLMPVRLDSEGMALKKKTYTTRVMVPIFTQCIIILHATTVICSPEVLSFLLDKFEQIAHDSHGSHSGSSPCALDNQWPRAIPFCVKHNNIVGATERGRKWVRIRVSTTI